MIKPALLAGKLWQKDKTTPTQSRALLLYRGVQVQKTNIISEGEEEECGYHQPLLNSLYPQDINLHLWTIKVLQRSFLTV